MKLTSTTALFAFLPALALAQDGPGGPNPVSGSEIPDNPAITGGEPAQDAPPIPSSTSVPIPVPSAPNTTEPDGTSVPVLPPLPHLNLTGTGSGNDTASTSNAKAEDKEDGGGDDSESAAWAASVPLGGALGMVGVALATTFF